MIDDPSGDSGQDPPLFKSATESSETQYFLEYDEDGSLALARALAAHDLGGAVRRPASDTLASPSNMPCKVSDLNGSWYLQLRPTGPHVLTEIRGPMRIEVATPKLRVSGDIYVRKPSPSVGSIEIFRPITESPLMFGNNWYPQFPFQEYSWYFRSLGISYKAGKLVFKFERHLWNRTTQEFINRQNSGKDNGFMQFECREGDLLTHALLPQPTLRLTGMAQIGGETYDAVATKTSPFFRGCAVEVDVMTNRPFPMAATTAAGAAISFTSIYRTAGMDCAVTVDQTNLPQDDELSTVELQTALTANRRPTSVKDAWRLWLLVGSSQGDLFGLMFDDIEPFREGTAGFFDPMLGNDSTIAPSARNKKLGEVPDAFLRTLVHEAGHAFNLFHPKHDVHNVPIGTTIMNQTGDVMGFATPQNPYPGNITFAFDDHNRTSLIHSPDPQVAPGWKRFGWGHGSLSSGVAEPIDALGLLRADPDAPDLALELAIPGNVFRGEFVSAQFIVTNTGAAPRAVTAAINLSQGDLRLLVKPPSDEIDDVRDVIIACGDRPIMILAPGESVTGTGQIFYTNVGFTFRQTGRYLVSAELSVGDEAGSVLRSAPVTVVVGSPSSPDEEHIARLAMTLGVGRAFAFGDYGTDQDAKRNLEELAARHIESRTGAAAALVLANAHSRDLRDIYSGNTLRRADNKGALVHVHEAADGAARNDPRALVLLASAVAAPTEANAPVLDLVADHLRQVAGSDGPAEGAVPAGDAPRARARTGRKRSGAERATEGDLSDAATARAAARDAAAADEALNLLASCRRTLAKRT